MTLHTHDNLCRVLDQLTSKPLLGPAMRSIGGSEKLIFAWLKRSYAGDQAFMVEWNGELLPFHEQVARARKQHVALFEAQLRNEVTQGIPEVQVKDGQIVWRQDPKQLADFRNAEEAADFGFPDWPYAHNERGERVALSVMRSAPSHLKIFVGRGLMPNVYGDHRSLDVRMQHSGTLTVGARRPPAIAAPVAAAITEAIMDDVDSIPEPEQQEPLDRPDIAALKRMVAEREANKQEPGRYVPKLWKPISPMDDDRDECGAGTVKPGGYRVA